MSGDRPKREPLPLRDRELLDAVDVGRAMGLARQTVIALARAGRLASTA